MVIQRAEASNEAAHFRLIIAEGLEAPSIGEYRMCQAIAQRLPHRTESCQMRKVASLLTEPLSPAQISKPASDPGLWTCLFSVA